MDETKQLPKYLRTLLRADVYDRLEGYAQSLATGYEKWDFGVAIERLLDMAMLDEKYNILLMRVETLEGQSFEKKEQPKEKVKDEKEELLGGYHLTEEIKLEN